MVIRIRQYSNSPDILILANRDETSDVMKMMQMSAQRQNGTKGCLNIPQKGYLSAASTRIHTNY